MRTSILLLMAFGLVSCGNSQERNIYISSTSLKTPKEIYDCIDRQIVGLPRLVLREFDAAKEQGTFRVGQGSEILWVIDVKKSGVTVTKSAGLIADPYERQLNEFVDNCA